jgi:Zn-dependent protease with chaperone function
MRWTLLFCLTLLTGCIESVPGPSAPQVAVKPPVKTGPGQTVAGFQRVVRVMEPVAERSCRKRVPGANCDFKILVDDRKNQPSNAYQTEDESGRPVIVFTQALINEAQNADELAFVLGHEAAHHIRGHLGRTQNNAVTGAILGGLLAAAVGLDAQIGIDYGGLGGARRFSKDYELEADELGTIITHAAGYDPVRGAVFFTRIPDPGDRFLGSHPPNAARIETVRHTASQL